MRYTKNFLRFLKDLVLLVLLPATLLAFPFAALFWEDFSTILVSGDPHKLAAWAQVVGAILLLPAIPFAWRGLREQRRVLHLNTRANVIQHCALRYDDLLKSKDVAHHSAHGIDGGTYYRRYWGLKSDQVDFYLSGWIDVDTMRSWIYSNCVALSEKRDPNLMRSWNQIKVYHEQVNPAFAAMINSIVKFSPRLSHHRNCIVLADELLIQLEAKTVRDRKMMQRKYDVAEFLPLVQAPFEFDHQLINEALSSNGVAASRLDADVQGDSVV